MRQLVTVAREFGSELNNDLRGSTFDKPESVDVLTRLHARACQVFEEVLCLSVSGFADGAMARWRTLHEMSGVALLITEGGDALATRYKAHYAVEANKTAKRYHRFHERLGHAPLSDEELARVAQRSAEAVEAYGPDFAEDNGWASERLRKKRPSVADILEAASIDHLAPYYKWASHNVHAGPNGVFWRLGLIGEDEILLAGPSNAGFADPAHAASLSLLQISSTMMMLHPAFDNVVMIHVLRDLADKIGDTLLDASRALESRTRGACQRERHESALIARGPR
jgi:hypothetical protein